MPEFAEALKGARAALPPPLPRTPPALAGIDRPRARSGSATVALILGCLGPCTAILGVVFGIVALNRISRSEGRLRGKGMAVTGLVLSGLWLVFVPVALGLLLPVLARNSAQGRPATCVVRLQATALALRESADMNQGKFPASAQWCEAALPHLPAADFLKCPSRSRLACGYAYNRNVAGRTVSSVPPETVLLIESARGWNATAGSEDPLPKPPHEGKYSVAFADGSVRQVDTATLPTLRWEP